MPALIAMLVSALIPAMVNASDVTATLGVLYKLSPNENASGVVSATGAVGVSFDDEPPHSDRESVAAITNESVFTLREFMCFPVTSIIIMISV